MASIRILFLSRTTNEADLSTGLHSHDFHQFLWVLRGRGRVRVGDVDCAVEGGDWVSFAPGVAHEFHFPTSKTARVELFQIKAQLSPDWARRFSGPPLRRMREHRRRIDQALLELLWAQRRETLDVNTAAEALLGWVALLLGSGRGEPANAAPQDERIDRILAWLEKEENPARGIHGLARQAGLHPSYFTRLFRARMGMTPSEWIIRRRLEKAHSLIIFSSAKLQEVAQLSGWRHYHHFFNQFTARYGVSPSKLRDTRDKM